MKEVINKSETLISFNEEMIDSIKSYINEFDYQIIPQSVVREEIIKSTEDYNKKKNLILLNLNIPHHKKILLFPAGIRKIKDPLFIMDEICEFLSKNIDYVCVLIGSLYEESNFLYNQIQEKIKHTNNFIISSSLDHKDFIILLKESHLVLNSSISEGMSNVILEAMNMGIPVLARKNQGNCKLIKNDINGFIFEDKEEFSLKLKILTNDDSNKIDIREKFILNGKNIIKDNFSYENELLNYERLVNEIMRKYYFKYDDYNLFFSKDTHPFSVENNKIFEVKYLCLIIVSYIEFRFKDKFF